MPPAVPLIAAAAGYAVSSSLTVFAVGSFAFGSGALFSSIAGFLVTTAINTLGSRLLSSKPKRSSLAESAGPGGGLSTMVRSSIESHKIIYGQVRVSGPIVFVKTTSSGNNSAGSPVSGENRFLHLVIALAGHEVDSMPTVYLNDLVVTLDANGFASSTPYLKSGLSYVRVKKYLGTDSQSADASLISECGLTSTFRLQGIAYVYVRMEWNQDIFPTGIPNVSVVVKGKKVYDPRAGSSAWSENAALCIRDYLASDYGFSCTQDEINDDYIVASANICDEAVSLSTGGSQSRYTCNGVVDTASGPLDNLNSLISAMAGTVTYVQGAFRVYAAAYDTPAGDITVDQLAGDVSDVLRTPRSELFNAVQGTYVDPNKDWQPTNFPPVTNNTYEDNDGGQRIYRDIELPFTNHPEAAQRLSKILLEKARQGIVTERTFNHSVLRYTVFDVVTLTDADMGWDTKPFRILKWATSSGGGISLTLQEESSASYDWNNGEATTVDTAPDTNLPNPFTVLVPTGVAFSSVIVDTRDGDAIYSLLLSWDEHSDAFVVNYGDFEIQFKLSSASIWQPSFKVDGALTSASVVPVTSVNTAYDLRIRAVNNLGVRSNWVTILNAVAGSSGGVGSTLDYGEWVSAPGATIDYGEWVSAPSPSLDYGYFT